MAAPAHGARGGVTGRKGRGPRGDTRESQHRASGWFIFCVGVTRSQGAQTAGETVFRVCLGGVSGGG